MLGIEIAEKFYYEYGDELLKEFDDLKTRIAVGIAGNGSECLGFDDEISRDHDFSAGFTMWLTDEDFKIYGVKLNEEYRKLPNEFLGVKLKEKGAFSNGKFGAMPISSFFQNAIGSETIPLTWQQWFYTPSQNFLEATNGKIFFDNLGIFTEIRRQISSEFPTDVRLKKLSAHLALMAQSGQYNYLRMVSHGGAVNGEMAIHEFTKHCSEVIFLLENQFAPYYKWRLKALSKLNNGKAVYQKLLELLSLGCNEENVKTKSEIIENIANEIILKLKEKSLSYSSSDYLETHSIEIAKKISNQEIKHLHIMEFGG